MTERVCVVGAGPGGVVTGAVFARDGFDVTVYEKFDEVGGTWSSERRYVGLASQADRGLFEFSAKPNETPFPDAEAVQRYLREYADEHGVAEDIEFETEVVGLTDREQGWTVTTSGPDGTESTTEFDYVVVCSGLHHLPKIPDIPGLEAFEGPVRHTNDVDSHEVLADQRVVTVGFGKSALDISVEASRVGESSALVFRRAGWHIPKRLLGGTVPYKYLLFSRLGGSLLPQFPDDDVVRPIDRLPSAAKDLLWRAITKDFVYSSGLHRADEDLIPENDLPADIARSGVYPDEFADRVADDGITTRKGSVDRLDEDGVCLTDGTKLLADVVVFGTGFRQAFPFLEACPDLDLRTDDGDFGAYRSLVPPGTDGIGFVGLRQTHNNFLSMEVSAHWLAAYFQDELDPMPTTEEMHADVEDRLDWHAETLPDNQGYDFGPYVVHTPEQLLVDLGIDPEQAPNPLAEYVEPVKARWYDDLHEKRVEATRR
jgi:cation diffusion facilitator CzcD-associated flavoprotein CzcO